MSGSEEARETLLAQYGIAMDLYTHEDVLNWGKLRHLVYATAGLLAIVGFVVKTAFQYPEQGLVVRWGVGVVAFVGVLVAVAFGVALHAGVHYLQYHKETLRNLESALAAHGGQLVLSPDPTRPGAGGKLLDRSPTVLVLRFTPVAIALAWLVVLVLAIVLPGPA